MAYDSNGNYVKSAGELVNYLDSGAEFRDPTLINTNSILDMEPIFPVSNSQLKSTNSMSSIATAFQGVSQNASAYLTIAVYGVVAAFAVKMLMKR